LGKCFAVCPEGKPAFIFPDHAADGAELLTNFTDASNPIRTAIARFAAVAGLQI
jgi:hypothetical protein